MKTELKFLLKSPKNNFEPQLLSTHIVRNFYIVESLEHSFLSAQLEIDDKGGWIELFPLTGNEIFEIEILQEGNSNSSDKTISIKKVFEFEIFDIRMEIQANKKGNIYTFILVEKGFFNFTGKFFSKSFKEKRISEIVTDICVNQLKFDENKINYKIEETAGNIDFVIPYWKANIILKYLCKITRRNKAPQESGFVFFTSLGPESSEKSIKQFTSLATLLEQTPNVSEDKKFYLRDQTKPVTYINNILEMSNPSLINRVGLKNGIQGKTYFGVDLNENKKIIKETKILSDFVKNSIFLGDDIHFEKNIEDKLADVKFKGYSNIDFIKSEMEYKFRMSFETINERVIYCKGLLDRYVGKIIYIEERSGDTDSIINSLYSGTWLIKKIIHNWSGNSFEQKLNIVKNSFDKLEKNLNSPNNLKTEKKNV